MLKSPPHDNNETTTDHSRSLSDPVGPVLPTWNTLNSLLLLQAIYHYGDDRWPTVSRVLRQHRLVTHPEGLTPKNCEKQYKQLITELEEERIHILTHQRYIDMPAVMKLAGRFHALRVEELKRCIKEDEDRIRTLVEEIHQIRTGQWDEHLLKNSDKVLAAIATTTTSSPATRPELSTEEEIERLKTWRKLVLMIWRDLANHRYASVFAQPIRRQQAPGYYDIKINTTDEFHHDMLLIFQNALMYNPVGSEIYQMALEMMEEVDRAIVAFRQTESSAWQAGHRRRKSSVNIDHIPLSVKSRSSSPPLHSSHHVMSGANTTNSSSSPQPQPPSTTTTITTTTTTT
ncbi:hypothetical protein BDF19DRAFT_385319 [Syncephalis fuscata]|nr:hypothetical protein BDF19DRAFT_385319 [Syncephalis fuscata]